MDPCPSPSLGSLPQGLGPHGRAWCCWDHLLALCDPDLGSLGGSEGGSMPNAKQEQGSEEEATQRLVPCAQEQVGWGGCPLRIKDARVALQGASVCVSSLSSHL